MTTTIDKSTATPTAAPTAAMPTPNASNLHNIRMVLGIITLITSVRVGWELLLGPRSTLNEVTTRVFQTWQVDDLKAIANNQFFSRPDRTTPEKYGITIETENLAALMQLYAQQLGKLKRYRVIEEKVDRNSRLNIHGNVYATYRLDAEFEKAPATIRLYFDLYGNWKLHHFIIQSAALSPCLSQVDWQLCSAHQARQNTPAVIQTQLAKIQTQRQCVGCDLSYLNFARADLRGVNLHRANLDGSNFTGANLQGANLQATQLHRTQFKAANLTDANLREAVGAGIWFDQANLNNANLEQTELPRSRFTQANLQGARFDRANLEAATFYQADLHHAQLNRTSLFQADFRQARMTRTEMNGANLQCARMGGAAALRVQVVGALMDGAILPNQALNLPTSLARRKDVALRCSS
jgi:uncharacterized protein YjbI with pentapeptide repeats